MKIFETLKKLGLSSEDTRMLYSNNTRDLNPLNVYKDSLSGVIFIDDFYVGSKTYEDGGYRPKNYEDSYEAVMDCKRRKESYENFYIGKRVLDFGCGSGDFLRSVNNRCITATGVELQKDFISDLRKDDIPCFSSLELIKEKSQDIIFSFHVIEHLQDPIKSILELKKKLRPGGKIIIEVPHARDFLLEVAINEKFKEFTLWSQHLLLHTRSSLKIMLEYCGFTNVIIEGVQRYSLSNHLQWLSEGKPGGHKSKFSMVDSKDLYLAYSSSLQRIDCTDTLVAFAEI